MIPVPPFTFSPVESHNKVVVFPWKDELDNIMHIVSAAVCGTVLHWFDRLHDYGTHCSLRSGDTPCQSGCLHCLQFYHGSHHGTTHYHSRYREGVKVHGVTMATLTGGGGQSLPQTSRIYLPNCIQIGELAGSRLPLSQKKCLQSNACSTLVEWWGDSPGCCLSMQAPWLPVLLCTLLVW